MLGKLFKYEFKQTMPLMLGCNIVLVIVSLLAILFINGADSADYGSFYYTQLSLYTFVASASVLAVIFLVKYFFFYRYYKNLYTDEGYLMLTLPVGTDELILSKAFVAFLWKLITVIVAILCVLVVLIFFSNNAFDIISRLFSLIGEIIASIDDDWPLVIMTIVLMIASSFFDIFTQYFAVSLGQMANKGRFRKSILALAGIQIVVFIVLGNVGLLPLFFDVFDNLTNSSLIAAECLYEVWISLILAAGAVGFFFLDKYFLDRKVNIE